MLARLLPDFGPAREHPAFRRLLVGGLLSSLGGSMTNFAVVLQVWDLTRSSLAVGLLGLTFVPVLVVGLLGGPDAWLRGRRGRLGRLALPHRQAPGHAALGSRGFRAAKGPAQPAGDRRGLAVHRPAAAAHRGVPDRPGRHAARPAGGAVPG